MDVVVLETPDAAAAAAADFVVREAEEAIAQRGQFTIALSGAALVHFFEQIAKAPLEWASVHVFQVDERAAPDASAERHLTTLRLHLLAAADIPAANVHPMPVGLAHFADGANRYAEALRAVCGDPPVLDLVHLDLAVDGHTASLFAGEDALGVEDSDVVATGVVDGRERLTLTMPVLRRARTVMFLVTGRNRAEVVRQLVAHGDIPAARLRRDDAVVFTDRAAGALVERGPGVSRARRR